MAVRAPIPVAIRLEGGLVIRGHEWSHDGPPVVFLHDLAGDLDTWGSVPETVAASGFRVISLDLPGHGLSDGEPEPDALADRVDEMLREVRGSFGPVALVASGATAEILLRHDAGTGAPVQIMVSPSPLDPAGIDWRATTSAMRLILSGTLNEAAHGYVDGIYPKLRGQRMLITGASEAAGPALLEDQPQLVEHLIMFARQYLVGHHLEWIAAHAEQIEAARSQRAGEDE